MCKFCSNDGLNKNIKEREDKKIFIYKTEFDIELCVEDEYKNIISAKIFYCPICGEKISN